jgi:uncharacterized membrane protein YkvI
VGAGFASGQEIWQFFGQHGPAGLFGVAMATVLFLVYGLAVMGLGRTLEARSHLEVVRAVGGRWLAGPMDVVITGFLFGALSVMAAGAGALASEQWGLPPSWGAAALMAMVVGTVLAGLAGVVRATSLVAPVLLVAVVGVCAGVLARGGPAPPLHMAEVAVSSWPLSALLYVSYNLVMAVAVLAPLGALATRRRVLLGGAVAGAAGLGLGAGAVYLAIAASLPWTLGSELPMVQVAGRLGPGLKMAYAVVLLAEVYTTAVASLYGWAARLGPGGGRRFRRVTLAGGGGALAASQLGFACLVRVVYPLVGYAGLLFLGALTYRLMVRR